MLAFVLILVVLQLWLLTATMNAYLGGDDAVVWPAAGASLALPAAEPRAAAIPPAVDAAVLGVSLMVPHRSIRTRPVVAVTLVLAATLSSCGRGADNPPAGNRAAADAAAPAPTPSPSPPPRELTWSGKVDMKLWSSVRVKAYKVALGQETPPHARHPAHPAAQTRGAGLRRDHGRGARPRGRPD